MFFGFALVCLVGAQHCDPDHNVRQISLGNWDSPHACMMQVQQAFAEKLSIRETPILKDNEFAVLVCRDLRRMNEA